MKIVKIKHIVLYIMFLIVILFIVIYILFFNIDNRKNNIESFDNVLYSDSTKDLIKCLYYDKRDFINIKKCDKNPVISAKGCIVPHHLVAKDLIHEVFQNISDNSNNRYDTVVLLGPDHESKAEGQVFSTNKNYDTPYGELKSNLKIINALAENDCVTLNDEKMTLEHSTSSIVPFVKYYFKDSSVVTLAISKQTKPKKIKEILNNILENSEDDRLLFVASVDFSHYLTLNEANEMDIVSMDLIENRNVEKIMTLNNDYMDSPISIVTMLYAMDKLEALNILRVNHSNMDLILKNHSLETTSYLTYIFY